MSFGDKDTTRVAVPSWYGRIKAHLAMWSQAASHIGYRSKAKRILSEYDLAIPLNNITDIWD
jgi:hypothetical protein